MQTGTQVRYIIVCILICSSLISVVLSDFRTDTGSEAETCSIMSLPLIEDQRYVLAHAGSVDCPVYSTRQQEIETDDDDWGTSQLLGGEGLGQEIYYEPDGYGAYWICYPDAIIRTCQNITLAERWHLEAYHFYEKGNANAKTYALPDGKHLLPAEQAFATEVPDDQTEDHPGFWPWPPTPDYADPDVMAHITGDDTPLSYLEASLFSRALQELGAAWHGISWGVTHIINTTELIDGDNNASDSISTWSELTWIEPVPELMEPTVCCSNTSCKVTWYTRTSLHEEKVVCTIDTYQRGSYRATPNDTIIATGGRGFYW